jgi:hypothetical protein
LPRPNSRKPGKLLEAEGRGQLPSAIPLAGQTSNQQFSLDNSPLVSATITQGPQSRIEIKGEVGSQKCTWLLDTGAQISVLSADLAQKARGIRAPAQYIPHTVDGSIMSTVCDLIADCDIGGQIIKQHRFTIVKDCTYPAILGMDLFSALNVKIHMGNIECSQSADTINTKNRLTRQSGSTPVVGRIYATRNVEVPGRSMFVFQGKVEAHIDPGTPVMVDAALDQGSERLGLGCGRVLDTVRNEGHVLMHMINPSTEVCRVQKGTLMRGHFLNSEQALNRQRNPFITTVVLYIIISENSFSSSIYIVYCFHT